MAFFYELKKSKSFLCDIKYFCFIHIHVYEKVVLNCDYLVLDGLLLDGTTMLSYYIYLSMFYFFV